MLSISEKKLLHNADKEIERHSTDVQKM